MDAKTSPKLSLNAASLQGCPRYQVAKGRVKVKGQFCGPGATRPQVSPCLAVLVSLSIKWLKNTSSAPFRGLL